MRRLALALALVMLATLPLWMGSTYYVNIATQILFYAIFALAVNVLAGYAGLVSLGHAGLFGIAAYAAAKLMGGGHGHAAVAAGALAVTVAAAAAFAVLALRGTGLGFVMITVALATFFMTTTRAAPVMGPSRVPVPPAITIRRASADAARATACGLTNWW